MMKLAYRVFIVTLVLFTFVLAAFAQDDKNRKSAKDDRNTAPTVGTGGPVGGPTGLFTVYDGQTLRTGEYTFSAAYSNFDRDPGNADFTEVPISFQIGVTDNIELFFNTDAYRAVKVNSPRNLSGFYLPNSQLRIGNALVSGPAIIQGPSGPGTGIFENAAVYRPTGTQPFVQFPYIGGSAGNFGLSFSGPVFGFPANTNALISGPVIGGSGASNFPGLGSVFGGILPGIVLQTACSNPLLTVCPNAATVPTVFTTAPSYLPDAPFINRTYSETAFSTYSAGAKFRFNNVRNPVGYGVIVAYRWYADNADDFAGFNQLQRGASPGGGRGDILVTAFADARLRKWLNISGNVGYHYNSSVRADFPGGTFTLLDRPDELVTSIGVDFPVNRFFQPIAEFRSLQYVGGRTPNAFENHPRDGIVGARIFPVRWAGFGFAYRYHFNQQDRDSFSDETNSSRVFIPPSTTPITTSFTGVPPGFQTSSDPHGFIVQLFIGRRDERQNEIINPPANVTNLTLSDSEIKGGCQPGFRPKEGQQCNDNTSINVSTTAVDPDNDVLTYNYTVSGGRIVGQGANVSWDLSGAQPGTYTITAGVDDGCGLCGKTETRTVTVASCECEQVVSCACPTLSVSGPAGTTSPGEAMTFTATAAGGSGQDITYNWTVSAGTIEAGQGTPSISVRTTPDMAGTSVTATVQIGGLDPNCNCTTTASEVGGIDRKPEPSIIDEFGKAANDVIRGKLDVFFLELSNNPTNQGYIINYGTDREIAARERLIRNHIAFRRFDASRITLVNGGASPDGEVKTKLYRIPPGADNPAP